MAIPTPDLLGMFYPSKNLTSPGAMSPDRSATNNSTLLSIHTNSLTEATDFWNGAVGFFVEPSQAALRGICFHVKKWDSATKLLQITSPLPVVPTTGDVFKIFVGGKCPSSHEVLSLKVSGKQPEIDTIAGTNVTGVTIKKASAMLGEGTLSLVYNASTRSLTIRMGSGSYGPDTFVSANATNLAVYNSDLAGFILVDVVFASLKTGTSTYTDTFTLTIPKGNLIPNMEGYETNDGQGRTRYHLVVAKNKATESLDVMNALSLWSGRPDGTTTNTTGTFGASFTAPQVITVNNATTWPTRGFWIRNRTKNDLRYVDYRSGNSLYTKAIDWGTLAFRNGTVEIKPGMTIANAASAPTATAIVDQVILTGGTWGGGDAAGTLLLKKHTTSSTWGASGNIFVDNLVQAIANTATTRGYRNLMAQSWVNADIIEPTSDIDIGINTPVSGLFRDPPDENTAPDGVTFKLAPQQSEAIIHPSLMGGETLGIWLRQTIIDGTQARDSIEGDLYSSWY